MNCPHHIQIYVASPHSYRDLPVRFFETTAVYRDEQAGELGGLTRVRSITQDDAHIFCREDQIENEFDNILKQVRNMYRAFHIKDLEIALSLRDPKNKKAYLGDDRLWQEAQEKMENMLKKNKIEARRAEGEAAFYGPKMDVIVTDALGREWQIATIQLDFNLPTRFGLEYTDEKGDKQTPVMIHSALLGSLERFMGFIIEHFSGALPLWLAPEQVWVVPVSEKFNAYARSVMDALRVQDPSLRVVAKYENETLGRKIREGQVQKIPYLLIVGEREEQAQTVSVRSREKGDEGSLPLEQFAATLVKERTDK
jgi:threonyl-tRNA synthetase